MKVPSSSAVKGKTTGPSQLITQSEVRGARKKVSFSLLFEGSPTFTEAARGIFEAKLNSTTSELELAGFNTFWMYSNE